MQKKAHFIFVVICIVAIFSILASTDNYSKSLLRSWVNYCFILSTFVLFLISMKKISLPLNYLLFMIWMLVCYVFYGSISSIPFLLLFISMTFIPRIISSRIFQSKDISILNYCIIAIAVLLIYLSTTEIAYDSIVNIGEYTGRKIQGDYLTFGFNNSNEAGMKVYCVISIAIALLLHDKVKFKIALIILIPILIYLLYLTKCRSSIVSFIIVLFLFFINLNSFAITKKSKLITLLLLSPIIFLLVYVILYLNSHNNSDLFLGKPIFSGRETIFIELMNKDISSILLFGNMGKYSFGNTLNSFLAIIANIGFLGFLLYFSFMLKSINQNLYRCKTKSQLFALLSIIGVFFISCSESAILVGGGFWFFSLLSLFIMYQDN